MRKKGCTTITVDVERELKDAYIEHANSNQMTMSESIRLHMISETKFMSNEPYKQLTITEFMGDK